MHEPWEDDEPPVLPAHKGIPPEARRIGLNRNTEEGALLEFASSLNGAKPSHKLVAWFILAAFVAPPLLTALGNVL